MFVSATTSARSDLRRIAAPKTLLPSETPSSVIGRICFSMTSRSGEQSSFPHGVLLFRAVYRLPPGSGMHDPAESAHLSPTYDALQQHFQTTGRLFSNP
ncbi:hypothetical protein AJ87_24405 [Rhizobium yanglingense]|nr:hypothetical protein AJ87_24405 [Rhizobium yanglingense]